MAFDTKGFIKAKFEPRVDFVPVPFLKDFFGQDEIPQFKVRGLDIYEFAKVKEAKIKDKNIEALIKALTTDRGQIEALKTAVGITSDDVPGEAAGRIEAFRIGVIEPEFNIQETVILAKRFPIDFWLITQKIFELTGQGMEIKKPSSSGDTMT